MRCKAIATDIDGTLLDKHGDITKKTHEALSYLVHKNIHVFLCSARPPFAIFPIVRKLGIKSPFIAYNGGQVLSNSGEKLLRSKYIPPGISREIISSIKGLPSVINVYIDNVWYTDTVNLKVEAESRLVKSLPEMANNWDHVIFRKHVSKMLFFYNEASLPKISAILSNYSKYIETEISKKGYLEVLPCDARKSTALKKLSILYKISPKSIVAIGDNYNDVAMFKFAGYSIALGNSPVEVKKNASWVSAENNDDGFFHAVDRVIKLGFIK
jgi:Cof subfamily protein (haloacid dehalogenase superfamily)